MEDKSKYLYDKYPELFEGRKLPVTQNLMSFGLPGPGWHNIIEKFCERVSPLVKDFPENDPLMFMQVKEKFGTLRIYMTHYSEPILEATREAEEASAVTCEECGEPGSWRSDRFWKVTECDSCHSNSARLKRLREWRENI